MWFSLHYLYMYLETPTTNIKWKNCIIWYYLCINVAIDEVIYGASSTPEKQRSTAKQQHHLKIRQMSRNCSQANRPEPNQLHMKRMHIYLFIELKAIKHFFFFLGYLPHTRPSKEPSPNGLIEASETSIRLNMFRQIQVNPRSRHHRLGSITITITIVIVLFLDAACWNVGKGSKIATEFEDFRGGSEGVGIIRVRDWDLVKGSSSSSRRRRRRRR